MTNLVSLAVFARRRWRKWAVVIYDTAMMILSYVAAYIVRLGWPLPPPQGQILLSTLILLLVCRQVVFVLLGLYRSPWRYASVPDAVNIVRAVMLSSGLFMLIIAFYNRLAQYPRSVPFIDALFLVLLLGGGRIAVRAWREGQVFVPRVDRGGEPLARALIVGAGDCGEQVVRELERDRGAAFDPIGFVDDADAKQNSLIRSLPVMGRIADVPRIVADYGVRKIIIAVPSAPYATLRGIYDICRKTGADILTVPNLAGIAEGRVDVRSLRLVQIEDLLGRDAVKLNLTISEEYLRGKRVLVTGAGGSIGSEICRQILGFGPAGVVLMGHGENSIFDCLSELKGRGWGPRVRPVVGCFTRRDKVRRVFAETRPQVVFHAGAHKHVDLMESEPDEAVWNNVIGTRNILEAAREFGAERVVCISTDKAADPVSAMGCSKRIAEMLIQTSAPPPIVVGVRFGNVLGSRGSVVPVFRRQIETGGPVTVTHPEMTRFFMTIPEAVQLVIQAGAIGEGGDVFMLDMGEPIRIADLARDMIELSGLRPGIDIDIQFTGMRPGERLVERLVGRSEILQPTDQPKIFRLGFSENGYDWECLAGDLGALEEHSVAGDAEGVVEVMQRMVPDYRPGAVPAMSAA